MTGLSSHSFPPLLPLQIRALYVFRVYIWCVLWTWETEKTGRVAKLDDFVDAVGVEG